MTPILKCNILQLANNQHFSGMCAIFYKVNDYRLQITVIFFSIPVFFCVSTSIIYIFINIYLIAYFVKVFGLLHFSIKKTDFLISDFC